MRDTADRYRHIAAPEVLNLLKLTEQPDIISFAGGTPAPATFAAKLIAEATANTQPLLQYSPTQGLTTLRQTAAAWLSAAWTTSITPDQILITSGSQQALDIIARTFVNPGESIFVEDPTYFAALYAFNAYEPVYRVITPDHLPKKVTGKLMYLVPNFHNPTGRTLSAPVRKKIAGFLIRNNLFLVEDDPYGQLYFDSPPPPPIFTLAPHHTIYTTSLSKIAGPALRLGIVVADPQVIQQLTQVKTAMDLCTSARLQQIGDYLLSHPDFPGHLANSRNYYRRQAELLIAALSANFSATAAWTIPTGGLFTWLTLQKNIDSTELLKRALQSRVAFAPGNIFRPSGQSSSSLRLSYALATSEQISTGISALAKIVHS